MSREVLEAKVRAGEYFFATADEQIVGLLRFCNLWSSVPFIELIFVTPAHRRSGAGRAMLEALENWVRGRGEGLVTSSAQSDEPEPRAWHSHVGFREAGAIKDLR